MFRNITGVQLFLYNVIMILLWHLVVFLICIHLSSDTLNPEKSRYKPHAWENNGRFYRDKLKIQLWKDRVPQYIGKEGFSKRNLTDVSIAYLDAFILETCRAEWTHAANSISFILALLMNTTAVGLFFSLLIFLANFPFIMIQRYNRFRLIALRKRKLKELWDESSGVTQLPAQSY